MTRRFSIPLLLAALPHAMWSAPRTSWNRVLYVGGTLTVKAGPYDWNTTITIKSDSIVVSIMPATVFKSGETVRIAPSKVVSLSYGAAAWLRVAEVAGAHLPPKPPSLFGILSDGDYTSFAIIWQTPDGKTGAMLLESLFAGQIQVALRQATGKQVDKAP